MPDNNFEEFLVVGYNAAELFEEFRHPPDSELRPHYQEIRDGFSDRTVTRKTGCGSGR